VTKDPGIPVYATIREAENDEGEVEHHIECRFADGQKYAAVAVSLECAQLADLIAQAIERHNARAVEPRVTLPCKHMLPGVLYNLPCQQCAAENRRGES
jgi:hypothetical protein